MKKEIRKIIRQYPKTDDCKFQTLGELHKWQIGEITELINSVKEECMTIPKNINFEEEKISEKHFKIAMEIRAKAIRVV